MSDKGAQSLACAVGMVGLAWLGFEYDSGWAFAGAVFCLIGI